MPIRSGVRNLFSQNTEGIMVAHEDGIFPTDVVSKLWNPRIQVTSEFTWADECATAAEKAEERFQTEISAIVAKCGEFHLAA